MDLYDDQGYLICTDQFPARRTATGDNVMNSDATAVLKITNPAAARTYRVWVVR